VNMGGAYNRDDAYFSVEDVNDNVRNYHSRMRLLDDGQQYQGGLSGAEVLENGSEINPILAFTLSIQGVVEAVVKAHAMTIRKSPLFSWSTIDESLVPLWYGIKIAIEATDVVEIEAQRQAMREAGLLLPHQDGGRPA